jgi:hypothetical protein
MTTGTHPDRAPAGWGTHHTIGGDAPMAVEIEYRMKMIEYRLARLRTEAEHERLAAMHARRSSARLWLGRALVTFGRFVEGTGAGEQECGSSIRA